MAVQRCPRFGGVRCPWHFERFGRDRGYVLSIFCRWFASNEDSRFVAVKRPLLCFVEFNLSSGSLETIFVYHNLASVWAIMERCDLLLFPLLLGIIDYKFDI